MAQWIRDEFKKKGVLGESTQWNILRDLCWTEARRSDAAHYKNKKGLIIQMNGHVKGFTPGEPLEFIGKHDGLARIRSTSGFPPRIKGLLLTEFEKLNVYERGSIEVCAGE